MRPLYRFLQSDDATTAVEYAVMLACIVLVATVGIKALGGASGGMWGNSNAQLNAAGFGSP